MKYRQDGEHRKVNARIKNEVYDALERLAVIEDKSLSLKLEEILSEYLENKGMYFPKAR